MDRRLFLGGLALALAAPARGQEGGQGTLILSASLGGGAPLAAGLRWRVFAAAPDSDGQHRLIVESSLAAPSITAPAGDYVVHVAFGLASATRSVTLTSQAKDVKLSLSAGALRIHCVANGERPIDPSEISLAIYVPERNNATAKLVYAKGRVGDVIGVPEGNYHIASTYLDTVTVGTLGLAKGAGAPTNSIAAGDVNVATGRIVDVTLRHRIAKVTIKLVSAPGSGAYTNTTFTVLTPGGDIVRELAGAFPSLVLAEGEYVVVARHDAHTYQATFTVQSGMDREVEVLAA